MKTSADLKGCFDVSAEPHYDVEIVLFHAVTY